MVKFVITGLFPALLFASEQGVTVEVPRLEVVGVRPAVLIPPTSPPVEFEPLRLEELEEGEWVLIDSIAGWRLIPAEDRWGVKFDYETETLKELPLSYVLSDSVLMAVESAPVWLQKDLLDAFRRLHEGYREIYARKVLEADPLYRDEIAFQVAHLSPKTLQWLVMWPNQDLLDTNVVQLYRVDPDLEFVELVEYGDPANGDWYTTTRYRLIEPNGDTAWAEIPKEIYYWWVMMPKLSDEEPTMDASVYNRFWRDYLYNEHDPGYPLMKEVLADLKVFWDGEYHVWPYDREFTDTMLAVDAVGQWVHLTVPYPASGNRPIQPNVIAHEHNGNCGELQDLLNAAARAALLPVNSVNMWPQDHVWCEIYWPLDGNWYEYQIDLGTKGATHIRDSTTSYDRPERQNSVIWGCRADGYTWSVTDHYTPVCTLTVSVRDAEGKPVDGAELVLCSPAYWNPAYIVVAHWAHTDENGEYRVVIGDFNNYYIRVDSPLGHDPTDPNGVYQIIYSADAVPGTHFYWTDTLSDSMPELPVSEIEGTPLDRYKLELTYQLPYRTLYGHSYWQRDFRHDDWEYSLPGEPGGIDFFICDTTNYQEYTNESPFEAYEVGSDLPSGSLEFVLPKDEDFYAIFSDQERLVISQLLEADIRLYRWEEVAVKEPDAAPGIRTELLPIAKNPVRDLPLEIVYTVGEKGAGEVDLSVYDAAGRLIKALVGPGQTPGRNSITWDGKDMAGRRIAKGVYFVRMETPGYKATRKFIYLGGRF